MQSGTAGAHTQKVDSGMTIDRDGRDWGQARLEWTKDEFQLARQWRLVKADVSTVESQMKADTNGASGAVRDACGALARSG